MVAKVLRKDFRGSDFLYTLELSNGEKVLSLVPSHHNHPVDKPIGIKLEMNHVITFSSEEAAELFTSKV
jgi:iron(III) transport system ATP-binding protein